MPNIIKIFSGNANPELAKEICDHLDISLSKVEVRRFSDGEIFVEIGENVRGTDVFVIQPTCPPVNDHLMELVIMVDALRRASARRITATASRLRNAMTTSSCHAPSRRFTALPV